VGAAAKVALIARYSRDPSMKFCIINLCRILHWTARESQAWTVYCVQKSSAEYSRFEKLHYGTYVHKIRNFRHFIRFQSNETASVALRSRPRHEKAERFYFNFLRGNIYCALIFPSCGRNKPASWPRVINKMVISWNSSEVSANKNG